MNKITIIALGLLLALGGFAQTIILKQTVNDNLEKEDGNFGPNRRHFYHPYTGFGFVLGGYDHNNDTLPPTRFGSSFFVSSGTRYYRNFNPLFARIIDYEISYEQHAYDLTKDTSIALPVDNHDLKKAKYWMAKIGAGWSYQFNFKPKRGNQLGAYLSFGVYGDLLVFRRFWSVYEPEVSSFSKSVKVGLGRLSYVNRWDYGGIVRFGRTNWSLFAKYRYSDYFVNDDYNFKELPRIVIGLNFFPGNI